MELVPIGMSCTKHRVGTYGLSWGGSSDMIPTIHYYTRGGFETLV